MPNWTQLQRLFIKETWAEMSPWYQELFEVAYSDQTAILGIDATFDLDNPRVLDVLDQLFTKIAGVADTTLDDARALVAQQNEQGWDLQTLARKIKELGITQSPHRAKVIAVTETARGYSLGSQLYWRDAGVEKQEWLTASSEVCPICEPLNGKVVRLDEEFAPGILVPGDSHPICRCALSPVIAD